MNSRIKRLSATVDAPICITHLTNVGYLTGFTGSNAALLVKDDWAVLATDSRYKEQAANQCPNLPVRIGADLFAVLLADFSGPLLVEDTHLSWASYENLRRTFPNIDFRPAGSPVETLRRVKDADEIAALRRAGEIAVQALASLTPSIRPGLTEFAIARELESRMYDLGAQAPGFSTIVASGPNSAIPHHEPTHRQIALGDLLKIDFGAQSRGYRSDCTRTFTIGPANTWQREVHQVVVDAQAAGVAAVKAGTILADVDSTVRVRLGEHVSAFTHGLGHGVGLDIHEDPFFGPKASGRLLAHEVVTVEPGVYYPGCGGVRIEDTLLVTEFGCENLTEFPKELFELAV